MKAIITIAVAGFMTMSMAGSPAESKTGRVTPGQNLNSASMLAFGESTPPFGYVQFCAANPADCKGSSRKPRRMKLNMQRWQELNRINRTVNRSVTPVTDMELYNRPEYWTYPRSGSGDCEDYVLEKRKRLIARGWPPEDLLITVVLDQNNAGHAVLTAITDRGDLILDNQNNKIRLWNRTPYQYYKRQSQFHPSVWVSLSDSSKQLRIFSTNR